MWEIFISKETETRESMTFVTYEGALIETGPTCYFTDEYLNSIGEPEEMDDISDDEEDLAVEFDESLCDDCDDFLSDSFRDEQESDLMEAYAA